MRGKSEGLGYFPTSKMQGIFGKEYSFPMLATKLITLQIKERTGKEWNGNKNKIQQMIGRNREIRQMKQ